MTTEKAIVVGGSQDHSCVRVDGKVRHWPNLEPKQAYLHPDQLTDANAIGEAVGGFTLDRYCLERISFGPATPTVAMYVYDGTHEDETSKPLSAADALRKVFEHYVAPEPPRPGFSHPELDCLEPMVHIPEAMLVVKGLSQLGQERLGESRAHLMATDGYLAVCWGQYTLWDTEDCLANIPDEVFEGVDTDRPSLELCLLVLRNLSNELHPLFEEASDAAESEKSETPEA